MIIALSIALVIAIAVDIQQTRYRRRIVKTSAKMIAHATEEWRLADTELLQLKMDYQALDEGNQEIVENYENDFLTLNEKVETAQNSAAYDREEREKAAKELARIHAVFDKHALTCDSILHDLVDGMVEELNPKSE